MLVHFIFLFASAKIQHEIKDFEFLLRNFSFSYTAGEAVGKNTIHSVFVLVVLDKLKQSNSESNETSPNFIKFIW